MNIDHKKPENRPLYIFALIAVVVILFLNIFAIPAMQERSVEKTDYSTFLSNVERGNVSKAEVQDDYIYYVVRKNGEDVVCKTVRMDDPDLVSRLYEAGTSMEAVEPQKQSIFLSLVIGYVIPIVIFVFLGRWLSKKMMSSMGGGPGGAMSFGKSNAKVYVKSSTGIKFTDVAGEDEAKELLTEIVDYLHNPQKYTEIGASMPKGALLLVQVRHCSPRQLQEKQKYRFSLFPVRNLWKCLWAWVLPRFVICLNRQMRRHLVLYLLMRLIPLVRNVTAEASQVETMNVSRL